MPLTENIIHPNKTRNYNTQYVENYLKLNEYNKLTQRGH